MPPNAADEEALKKNEEQAKLERAKELRDVQDLMQTDAGRRFMWRVLERCKTFGDLWARDDASRAANIAESNIGRWLFAECQKADMKSVITMMTENNEVKKDVNA